MKWPQISLGRMMIFIAIVGILTWGAVTAFRGWVLLPYYQNRVREHTLQEKASIIAVREPNHVADTAELAALTQTWQAYHSAMRQKYESAVAFPWLGVAADPPRPVELSNRATGREVDLHFP